MDSGSSRRLIRARLLGADAASDNDDRNDGELPRRRDFRKKMSLVDLIDGTIYDISDFVETTGSGIIIKNIPAKDYPMLLTFGDFID